MSTDRRWMYRKNDSEGFLSRDYVVALDGFLDFAYANERKTMGDGMVIHARCPCARCKNLKYKERDEVKLHLLKHGFMLHYTIWYAHGEEHRGFEDMWDTDFCRRRSRVFGANWATKFRGVSSKYTGGSITAGEHRVRMRDEWGREPTDAELYVRLHTKRKSMDSPSTYVYPKAARTVKANAPVREETYVGSNPVTVPLDDPELSESSVGGQHKTTDDPNATSSSKSSSDNQSAEVTALKEKLASYEDQLETEKRKRLALEEQHKETTNELARQKAITEQFFAFMRQFQHENSPTPPM